VTAAILGCIVFCITTAASITLLGDRALLSDNLLTPRGFIAFLFHWRFILSMTCALISRFAFVFINHSLVAHPTLGPISTTVTSFITASAYVFIVFSNWYFLGERLDLQQSLGAGLIFLGIVVLIK